MRQLFQEEFLYNDIYTSIAVFFISIITTIGGVGGGGLLIPTFLLLDKFSLTESIPLSIITIMGDTLVRLFYLYPKKNILYCFFSIFLSITLYLSLVAGFFLGEDLNSGAIGDWHGTNYPVIRDSAVDLKNTLLK